MNLWRGTLLVTVWILLGGTALWASNALGLLDSDDAWIETQMFEIDFPKVYQMWQKREILFVAYIPQPFLGPLAFCETF